MTTPTPAPQVCIAFELPVCPFCGKSIGFLCSDADPEIVCTSCGHKFRWLVKEEGDSRGKV